MTDWYISSAAYATRTAWLPAHTYVVGDLVIPTAPVVGTKFVFRVTTAGTSDIVEPAWPTGNAATVTSASVVFTNVTGQSAFGWNTAAGDGLSIGNRTNLGDRIFISSDHVEINPSAVSYGYGGFNSGWQITEFLSVNRFGSVPPVAADLQPGATLIVDNAALTIRSNSENYWYGITFEVTTAGDIQLGQIEATATQYLKNCLLWLNHTSANYIREMTGFATGHFIFDNTNVQFGNSAQGFWAAGAFPGMTELRWMGGSVIGLTFPTTLFMGMGSTNTGSGWLIAARGVDFSNITGILVNNSGQGISKYLFESCKINPNVVRYNNSGVTNTRDLVALCNCFDGTHLNVSELWQPAGSVTTDISTVLLGGAMDDVSPYAHKMTTNTNVNKWVSPLQGFWMDIENVRTNVTLTLTVEIISSSILNNDDIYVLEEHQGAAGPRYVTSQPTWILSSVTPLPTSTATWLNPPATPVRQKIQTTLIPSRAGRIHVQVRLGKPNTTVWYNPQVVLT